MDNLTINIQIENLEVIKRTFFFDYIILLSHDGSDNIIKGTYKDTHNWANPEKWKELLLKGDAIKIVIDEILYDLL